MRRAGAGSQFRATWCLPCVQEMPELSRVRDEYPRDQVEVLGLGIDTVQRIAPFSVNHPVSYPVFALDTAGIEIARKMGNERGALPYTVVFARNGQVVLRKLGQIHAPELREVIGKALKIGAQ
ncbi:MAG: TlpA disulfide reductase family protein [Burkholderiaceae bacterium]